jgi:thiamine kinase-like enzyme
MSSGSDIQNELTKVVNQAAKKLDLKKYSLNLDLNVLKGDGFLGEFYKASITDDETKKKYDLAIKKAPTEKIRREENCIDAVYKNEIFFYSKICPVFKKFEEDHQVLKHFNSIPEYIISDGQLGKEIIVLKDITKEGFQLRAKDLLLDDDHTRLIFKTYGHFHAISFCLKQQKPEEFSRLTKPLFNIWKEFCEKSSFVNILKSHAQTAYEVLDPSKHSDIMEKLKKYVEKPKEVFYEILDYDGKYFGILHGDCWSNNMMFKYQNTLNQSKLEDMNLLDFQLVIAGTPVYDLSYFFYTGGSKELFDKLEDYLNIYYESFSISSKNLGNDPNELFPREELTRDWKRYSKFGMMLSLLVTKLKLLSKEDVIDLIDADDEKTKTDNGEQFVNLKYNKTLYKKRIEEILIHFHERDTL